MRPVLVVVALVGLWQSARSFVPTDREPPAVASVALTAGFLLLVALFAGRLFAAVRLPRLVAYIITGAVLGPDLLHALPESILARLDLVEGVAICLIAFTAGGELDLRAMRSRLKTIAALTLIAILGTSLLLAGALVLLRPVLPFLGELPPAALIAVCLMLGVALSAQSPAVVMALLGETGAEGPLSRTVLAAVVLADLVVVVLFGVVSSIAQNLTAGGADAGQTALGILWELFGSLAVGVVVGAGIAVYLRRARNGTALLVLIVCVVVAEVGMRVQLDPLLVMLTAGLYLENASGERAKPLIEEIEGGSLPVYVLFFALAGTALHVRELLELWPIALGLVSLRALGMWAGSALATRIGSTEPVVRRWAFAGLLPQAGLAIALAMVVQRAFGELGAQASALMLSVIAINELVMPIVFRQALASGGEIGPRAAPAALGEPLERTA